MALETDDSDDVIVLDKFFPWYDYRTADLDRIWLLTATPLVFSTVLSLTGIFYYVYLETIGYKINYMVRYCNYAFNISNITYLMSLIATIIFCKWHLLLLAIAAHVFSIYSQMMLAYLLYLTMKPISSEFSIVRFSFTLWISFLTITSMRILVILVAYLSAMGEGGGEWDLREPKSERVLRHERLAMEAKKNKAKKANTCGLIDCCDMKSFQSKNEENSDNDDSY